eukprot:165084_1
MDVSTLPIRLLNLWQIDTTAREKSIKLLSKIFNNILSNPKDQKYGNLNLQKLQSKFKKCPPAMDLLYEAGFKPSQDTTRLLWIYNDNNYNLLKNVIFSLEHKINEEKERAIQELINEGFTMKEASQAIKSSLNEYSDEWERLFCTFINSNNQIQFCRRSGKTQNGIVSNCSHLQRAIAALKLYEDQCGDIYNESKQNIDDKHIFLTFCSESYPNFLDDYVHIITNHDHELLKISRELRREYGFKKCLVSECNKVKRHLDIINIERKEDEFKQEFHCSYFDTLHHFIFHLHDIGIRTDIKQTTENNQINISGFDPIFSKKIDQINSKQKQSGMDIARYNQKNNKYNIKIGKSVGINLCKCGKQLVKITDASKLYSNYGSVHCNECGEDCAKDTFWHCLQEFNKNHKQYNICNKCKSNNTFMDQIFAFVTNNDDVSDEIVIQLKKYFNENEYDTEAVKED